MASKTKRHEKFLGYTKMDSLDGTMHYDNPWIKIFKWQHNYSWPKLPPAPDDFVKQKSKKFKSTPVALRGTWYSEGKMKYVVHKHTYDLYGVHNRFTKGPLGQLMTHPKVATFALGTTYYKHPTRKYTDYSVRTIGTLGGFSPNYFFRVKDKHGKVHAVLAMNFDDVNGTRIFYRKRFKGIKYRLKIKRHQEDIYGNHYFTQKTDKMFELMRLHKTVDMSSLK